MRHLLAWLLWITAAIGLSSVVVFLTALFFVRSSLPEYNKTARFEGLTSEIEIVRDTANIPHILGKTDIASMFGLGYVHAQDRLWQMTMLRRTAQGRLSEILGQDKLKSDILVRRLGIYDAAQNSVLALNPEIRKLLKSYTAGVNARLSEINANSLGRGAPEFFLFSNSIAAWSLADSLAILKLLGLQQSNHLQSEILRARVSLVVGNARVKDILPDIPGNGGTDLVSFTPSLSINSDNALNFTTSPLSLPPLNSINLSGASNAWAALPGRTAVNGSLLANDPHTALTAPSLWYLARLNLESGAVIGATIPGVPTIVIGRSANLGWGLTSASIDDTDLYIERLNPETSNQYQSANSFKPFIKSQSIITIKDQPSITLDLLQTDNGPILSDSNLNLQSITPNGHVVSVASTLLSPRDTSIEAMINIMRSQSVKQAIEASKIYIAPGQNLILADKKEIAMRTIGSLPKRHSKHQSRGRMPTRGWIAFNRWQGVYDQSVNPIFLNPTEGILGNTNNKIINKAFPEHVSYEWGDTERIQRWTRLMQSRSSHTRDSFIEIQLDNISPTARTLLPLIGAELWFKSDVNNLENSMTNKKLALELLANWNGDMNEHIPEPLIYASWIRALQTRLIQDELGPMHNEFTHVQPLFIERVFRNIDGAGKWCDVMQSKQVETCSEMAKLALDDALLWLANVYTNDILALRWGEAHQATHDHQELGHFPLLKWIVNIRQSTSGGDNTLQRGKTRGFGANPYRNVHAATYRGVYDFSDPDSSVFITSTGQSGHPLSRFYDNLGKLWRRGEYVPMSLDTSLARAGATGTTRLLPIDKATNQ
jgi:penicillin G amidase